MAYDTYATQTIPGGTTGHMTGSVPADFQSLIEASVWFIPTLDDVTHDLTIIIMAATVGELYNAHDDTPGTLYNLVTVQDTIYSHNITAQMPAALANGDVFGISWAADAGNETIHLLGVRFLYTIRYPEQSGLAPVREEFYPCEKQDEVE